MRKDKGRINDCHMHKLKYDKFISFSFVTKANDSKILVKVYRGKFSTLTFTFQISKNWK